MKNIIHNSYYTKLASASTLPINSSSSSPAATLSSNEMLSKKLMAPQVPPANDPYQSASNIIQNLAAKGLKAYDGFGRKITNPKMVSAKFNF